jgi:hypothetical protein
MRFPQPRFVSAGSFVPEPATLFSVPSVLNNTLSVAPMSGLPKLAYNESMRTSVLLYLSRAAVSLVALCLAIAPICSARCSLSSCLPVTSPAQSSNGCHHHGAAHNSNSLSSLAATICQISDSLLATLPGDSTRLLQNSAAQALAAATHALSTNSSASSSISDLFNRDTSPGILPPSSPSTPLRL